MADVDPHKNAQDARKANKRGAARLAAVQALYQMDLAGTGINEILAEFENDCRNLSASSNRLLRHELATQIEHELLRFADPDKQAVLIIALKHLDAL